MFDTVHHQADPTGPVLLPTEAGATHRKTSAATDEAARPDLDGLFRAHFDFVYRVVARLAGPAASEADIEDLTQQVFMTAHRALPRYRGEGKPTTWLYGIAANTVMTWSRGWLRQRRMLRELAREERPSQREDGRLASRAELRRVWQCLMRIKAKKRTVYVLFELEGLSGTDVAKALEIPEATVWTRLHHARRELAKLLSRNGDGTVVKP